MKPVFPLMLCLLLAGCVEPAHWVVSDSKDEFTDVRTKMLTTGSVYEYGQVLTLPGVFYPFIGIRTNTLYVGLRSGGGYRVPVGAVQMRIDDLPAWTITPDETPVDVVWSGPTNGILTGTQVGLNSTNLTKMFSPFTAATGDKATNILRQMFHGHELKYRTLGMSQAGSTTGKVDLDRTFQWGLIKLGIDTNSL
jgi:hypothetical protein